MQRQGETVDCVFTALKSDSPVSPPSDPKDTITARLEIRRMLEDSGAPSRAALKPGELIQGLCSPWQHDYRECACYYWPATPPGLRQRRNRPERRQPRRQLDGQGTHRVVSVDDRVDGRLLTYDDLFSRWEALLRFQIRGHDSEEG